MSVKMTVIMIFWIVVVVVIAADLIYMLAKSKKGTAVATVVADKTTVDVTTKVNIDTAVSTEPDSDLQK